LSAALRATASTLHLFGTRQNLQTAAAIGTLFARMGPTRMRRAERHVRWAFPDKSDAEVRAIALASVQHMFQLFLVDSVAGPQLLNEHGWGRHVEFGSLGSTMELLLTMPVNPWEAIVAKFLASWIFLDIALALTFPIAITANVLGDPDNGQILAGYFGSLFLSGAYLAITCMTSAMTRNQVISFILSVVLCLFLIQRLLL
jgi:hypothetical protein